MQGNGPVVIGGYTFSWGDILGKGVTGNVYKGTRVNDNYPVAVKAINLIENQNQVTRALLDTEIKALKFIKPHSNIIRTLDILQDNNFCFIITELYSGGTLKQLLQREKNLIPQAALQIFHKIVLGYSTISDASIIHRDLKPANIMLKQNSLEPVIIDFGFAEIIQTKTVMKAFNVGSPAYMAPQAFTKTLYSEKSDVWSLGIILYEMLTGQTLDEEIETKRYFSLLSDQFIAEKIKSFSQVFKEILSQVLRINPLERISIHKIKYILDKDAIMKMNNPIKSLHSSIEFCPSISSLKSEPILIHKSISLEECSKKQMKVNYQSGNVDLYNSAHHSRNGSSSNLTGYKARENLLSNSNHQLNFKTIQIAKSIEKTHQFGFNNSINHKISSLNFSAIPAKQINLNPLQNNQRQPQPVKTQFFNSKDNSRVQTESYPFRPKEVNLINVVSEKNYFSKPEEVIRPNHGVMIKQFGKENSNQPLFFKQRLTEQKRIIKQFSNPNKFSFKKLAEYQGTHPNESFISYENQQGTVKQSVPLRQYLNESITQINLSQNLYNSVNQTPKVIRNPINQPHHSLMRRLF